MWNATRFYVSSLFRGHANLLCIVPILLYVLPKQAHLNSHFFFIHSKFRVEISSMCIHTYVYSVYLYVQCICGYVSIIGVKLARIKPWMWSEEKAKVVAAVWGAEFLKFFAALAISYQDDLTRLICTRMS